MSINEIVSSEWRSAQLPPPPSVYRWDQDDSRYYGRVVVKDSAQSVRWYPSVTSVIRDTSPMPPHLLKWYADKGLAEANAIRDEAADYGTNFHIYASHLITGGTIGAEHFGAMSTRLQKDLVALIAWVREHNVKPLASEMLLVSDFFGVAGTVDLVCELDHIEKNGDITRARAVVDFKTSSALHRSHELQVNLYRHMWNEHYSDAKFHASEAILWRPKDWRKAPSWEAKDVCSNTEGDYLELATMCQLWKWRNPGFSPKPKTRFAVDVGGLSLAATPAMESENPDEVILDRHNEVTR